MTGIEKIRGVEHVFAQIQVQQQQIKKEKTDRKAYFKEYNDRMKKKRKLTRLKKRQGQQEETNEATSKYYGAEAIKILMSFKDYTELNKEKKQL
jgi:hypothetical protein